MFEAYSVAVRLKLVDDVTGGLLGIAGHFKVLQGAIGKTQAQILALEASWKKIKTTALIGGAALAGGAGALDLLVAPVKAAREYELAFTKFKTLNLGDSINEQANQFARANKLMNVSAIDLMKTLTESVGLFGTYAGAAAHAGQLAQLNAANSAIFGGKIENLDEGNIRHAMKFLDRRGALSGGEKAYQGGLNILEKIVTGSGGFVKFADLDTFSQHGGTAFRALSDAGLLNMALLLQEQGGAKAATGLMSGYQNLIGGRTPVKTMMALADMGLGTIGEIIRGTVGGKQSKSVVLKDIKDAQLYQENPTEWYRTTFLGALAAHGITDETSILKWTNLLLSNRNTSNQGSIMDTQTLQIIRDANLAKNAMGVDKVIKQYNEDPNQKWTAMTAKWKNMLIELGEAALPLVTKAMGYLLPVLKGITWAAHSFPGITKWVLGIGAAFAGLAVIGGTLTLIVAGIKGLALIPGLATAAAGLGAIAVPLLALAGVAASSYAITTWLDKKFHWSEKLGALYSGQDDYNPNKGFEKGKYVYHGNGGSTVTLKQPPIYLDGRLISDNTAGHLANSLAAPVGGQAFDSTMTLPSVGLNGVY